MAPEIWFSPLALALLGLCVGSFLNVVAHRMPMMLEREWWLDVAENQLGDAQAWQRVSGRKGAAPAAFENAARTIADALAALSPISLSSPRSRCPSCGHVLRWHENLPVIGWLRLKGLCS
jgi:leader peptidase (prepilin peptidase)/N-methyltransferase